MVPGFVQRCFFSKEHEAGGWKRKRLYSFNLPSRILDCLFAWCAGIAKCASCGVNKNVVSGSFCETLGLGFQKGDVSEEEDGENEQDGVEMSCHVLVAEILFLRGGRVKH